MIDKEEAPPVHHVYDGIVEEDNRLPNWWLAILFGTIVYGFGYWFVYETTASMPYPVAEYKAEIAALAKAHPDSVAVTNESLLAIASDQATVSEGQKAFSATCIACHAAQGQGLVGPNLTDNLWLHGSRPIEIHTSISNGFPEKGMPPWGRTLGAAKIRALTAFVLSIKGKNLTGKAGQGVPE